MHSQGGNMSDWYVLKNGKYLKAMNSPNECICLINILQEKDNNNFYSYLSAADYITLNN